MQDFKASLPEKGGLYGTFEDGAGFQSSLRSHLAALAQKFSADQKDKTAQKSGDFIAKRQPESNDDGELGFFDYIDFYELKMAELTSVVKTIEEATSSIAGKLNQRADEIRSVTKEQPDAASAKRVITKTAGDMNSYAETIERQIQPMNKSRQEALQSLSMALTVYEEFGADDKSTLNELSGSLDQLFDNLDESLHSLSTYRDSVEGLPRLRKL